MATLLPNSKLLVAGGLAGDCLVNAKLYGVGLGFKAPWQPKIRDLKLPDGKRPLLTGYRFQGIARASGGSTQDPSGGIMNREDQQ